MPKQNCYTDEWMRTTPDYAIYLPKNPGERDEYADHIHVFFTPGGDLMCMWTQGSYESYPIFGLYAQEARMVGRLGAPLLLLMNLNIKI